MKHTIYFYVVPDFKIIMVAIIDEKSLSPSSTEQAMPADDFDCSWWRPIDVAAMIFYFVPAAWNRTCSVRYVLLCLFYILF